MTIPDSNAQPAESRLSHAPDYVSGPIGNQPPFKWHCGGETLRTAPRTFKYDKIVTNEATAVIRSGVESKLQKCDQMRVSGTPIGYYHTVTSSPLSILNLCNIA